MGVSNLAAWLCTKKEAAGWTVQDSVVTPASVSASVCSVHHKNFLCWWGRALHATLLTLVVCLD